MKQISVFSFAHQDSSEAGVVAENGGAGSILRNPRGAEQLEPVTRRALRHDEPAPRWRTLGVIPDLSIVTPSWNKPGGWGC